MPIELRDYDPEWPRLYQREASRLAAALGSLLLGVEHVGSTAVPGLAAKPIVDLMAGVDDLCAADRSVEPITGLGYEYCPEFEDLMPERRFFRRSSPDGRRLHNMHLCVLDSPFWVRHLAFRDYLRRHPDTATEYEELKRELAALHDDVNQYSQAKTAFIRRIEARALSPGAFGRKAR